MIRVIDSAMESIADHKSDVMVFCLPGDHDEQTLIDLEARYPGLVGIYSSLVNDPKFAPGHIAIVSWGSERVMFMNPILNNKPNYIKIRDCLDKMVNVPERHKFKSIAIPHIGYPTVSKNPLAMMIKLRAQGLVNQEFNLYVK